MGGFVKPKKTNMIITEVFYAVKCDRCEKVYEGKCAGHYSDMDSALQFAKEEGWVEIGKKHYCPNCYVIDKDTEEVKKRPLRSQHVKFLERFINDFLGYNADTVESDDDYELFFYKNGLITLDEEYIHKMLGSNLLSLQCKYDEWIDLSKCMIKIKK